MAKIDGKYEQFWTENLLKQINSEDSITKRHRLIAKYLYQRVKQIEKVLANIEDDDIDLTLVIEQIWEDLELARKQLTYTIDRSDFYAKYMGVYYPLVPIDGYVQQLTHDNMPQVVVNIIYRYMYAYGKEISA